MWEALLSIDGPTVLWVAVKASAYLGALVGAGSALAFVGIATLDGETRKALRRLGLAGAGAAAVASLALLPMNAVFLAGGTWAGASDPLLLAMVAEGPMGTSLALRLLGLVLVALFFHTARVPKPVAVAGALVVCASFAFRGHVLAEPRAVLGVLATMHLLGVAFWIGAFFPLHRMARHAEPLLAGAAADEFGRKALWSVSGLVLAGGGLLILLAGNPLDALATPYGQLLAVKVAMFTLLLGFAAFNRLRLTPALLAGDASAALRLQRSIELEVAASCAILVTTATLTTIASPGMSA